MEGVPFDVNTQLDAARRLEKVGYEATSRVIAGGYAETFQESVSAAYTGAM